MINSEGIVYNRTPFRIRTMPLLQWKVMVFKHALLSMLNISKCTFSIHEQCQHDSQCFYRVTTSSPITKATWYRILCSEFIQFHTDFRSYIHQTYVHVFFLCYVLLYWHTFRYLRYTLTNYVIATYWAASRGDMLCHQQIQQCSIL